MSTLCHPCFLSRLFGGKTGPSKEMGPAGEPTKPKSSAAYSAVKQGLRDGGLGKKMGHDHLIVATPSAAAYAAENSRTNEIHRFPQ